MTWCAPAGWQVRVVVSVRVLLKAQGVKGLHVDGCSAVGNHVGNGAGTASSKADAVATVCQVKPDAVVSTGAGQGQSVG